MLPSMLLVALVLIPSPFVVLALFRAVARAVERRVLARASSPPALVRSRATGMVLLIAALAVVGDLATAAVTQIGSRAEGLAGLGLLLGTLVMLAGWVTHTVPGHSRGLKYVLVQVGTLLLGVGLSTSDDAVAPGFVLGYLALTWTATGAGLVVALAVIRPDTPLEGASGRAAHHWYRRLTFIQGADVGSILGYALLNLCGLVPAYLLIRYAAKAKLQQRPFLYLRSFRHEAAPRVFAEIVGPALMRRGTFVGLVHASQTQSSLQSGVPLLWAASFATVGDDRWQEWVLDAMSRAKGVVLDISGDTPGLRWEIEQARQRVAPARILVLRDRPGPALAPGVTDVVYDLDGGTDAARAEVAAFGARVNEDGFGVVDPAPRAFTTRRRLFGGFDIALAFSGLLLLLTVPSILFVWRFTSSTADRMRLRETVERAIFIEESVALERMGRGASCDEAVEALVAERGEAFLNDGWGVVMRVTCEEGSPSVHSAGPDGRWGTSDDREY